MHGMGPKRLAKLRSAVVAAKQSPAMAHVLLALGIRGVGATVAKKLDASCGGDLAVLFCAVTAAASAAEAAARGTATVAPEEGRDEPSAVLAAAGAGPVVTEALNAFCADAEAVGELMELFEAGVVPRSTDVAALAAALDEHAAARKWRRRRSGGAPDT